MSLPLGLSSLMTTGGKGKMRIRTKRKQEKKKIEILSVHQFYAICESVKPWRDFAQRLSFQSTHLMTVENTSIGQLPP